MVLRCTAQVSPGGQCQLDSHYVIVYSCFQEHIRERPLCPLHSDEWLQKFALRKWACTDCDTKQKIEEIYLCLATEVKVEWLNI